MTLAQAQAEVDLFIRSTGKGYFPEIVNLARLTEEVGELARIYSRRGYLKPKPGEDISETALKEELGDVFFVLLCLANQAGLSLQESLALVLEKYSSRDAGRHD